MLGIHGLRDEGHDYCREGGEGKRHDGVTAGHKVIGGGLGLAVPLVTEVTGGEQVNEQNDERLLMETLNLVAL